MLPGDKRPAYQWYPGDFRRDTAVQACPLLVRGLWREMLDLMHDGEPYGHLTAGGVAITEQQLARIVGESIRRICEALQMLEERQVFSRTPDGVIFSRRMVRDEEIRRRRAEGGKDSEKNPRVPRAKDGGKDGLKDGTKDTHQAIHVDTLTTIPCRAANADAVRTSSEAKKKRNDLSGFDEFWAVYPRREAKQEALKAWKALAPSAEVVALMVSAIERRRGSPDWRKEGGHYVPLPASWLRGRRWEDEVPAGARRAEMDALERELDGPWPALCEAFATQTNRKTMHDWLRPCKVVRDDGETLTVAPATEQVPSYLAKHYRAQLDAASAAVGRRLVWQAADEVAG